MTQRVRQVLESARSLSVPERLELIQEVSKSVAADCGSQAAASDFWVRRPHQETRMEQARPVIRDLSSLSGSFWPKEETTQEFLDFLAEQRLADRLESA